MKKYMKIGEEKIEAKDFEYDLILDLEDAGITIAEMMKKPMKLLRAYISVCSGKSLNETSELIKNNPKCIVAAIETMNAKMDEATFFREMFEGEEEETSASEN